MSESTAVKSKVFKEDLSVATGGSGAAETGTRTTSTGGTVTLTKLDASHIQFRSVSKNLNDLVDGGNDVNLGINNLTAAGTLTLSAQTTAGIMKNDASGVVSGGGSIVETDLPTGINAARIANGSISNTEFQYLNGVTSAIQTQISAIQTSRIIQVVNSQSGAVATGNTAMPQDDTIPQNTEGDEYITCTITPSSATNVLLIQVVLNVCATGQTLFSIALFQDSTANALTATAGFIGSVNNTPIACPLNYYMVAGTTSATTFKIRAGSSAGATLTVNGSDGGRWFGGVMNSSITISEIKV